MCVVCPFGLFGRLCLCVQFVLDSPVLLALRLNVHVVHVQFVFYSHVQFVLDSPVLLALHLNVHVVHVQFVF